MKLKKTPGEISVNSVQTATCKGILKMAELQVETIWKKLNSSEELYGVSVQCLKNAKEKDINAREPVYKSFYQTTRGYAHYNAHFNYPWMHLGFVSKELIDILVQISKSRTGRPLRIMDDGAGSGIFLKEIKRMLADRGIESETTATSLTWFPELRDSNIDSIFIGNSETYAPPKTQDVIVSVLGAAYYQGPQLLKERLLKYAYCLEKGGILAADVPLAGFNIKNVKKTLTKRGFTIGVYPDLFFNTVILFHSDAPNLIRADAKV
ncbi:MAG: hypothetical protein NTV88_00625 [Candidatus Micrarchaeota archaeon]|nr:hypothetical protein [Candidatus Micrarchaeota archaeon]